MCQNPARSIRLARAHRRRPRRHRGRRAPAAGARSGEGEPAAAGLRPARLLLTCGATGSRNPPSLAKPSANCGRNGGSRGGPCFALDEGEDAGVSATRATLEPMSIPSADPYADAVWATTTSPRPTISGNRRPTQARGRRRRTTDGCRRTVDPLRGIRTRDRAEGRALALRHAAEALHTVFGYEAFRGNQAAAIDQVVAGGDAVVLMPTGGGKSLIYQIPALVRPGTGLVVSPLIALMHDQVDALVANGVRAAYLNSTQAPPERAAVERAYLAGELDLIYVAPERLSNASTRALPAARHAQRHRDRRGALRVAVGPRLPARLPRRSASSATQFPGVPRVALTATATDATHREITERLRLPDARALRRELRPPEHPVPDRPEGRARASSCSHSSARSPSGAAGIVYALSRKSVEQTAEYLRTQGIDALAVPRRASTRPSAPRTRRASSARTASSWSPRSRSAWASTSPTCASSPTSTCRSPSRGTTRRPAAPGRDGEPAVAWMAYGLGDVVQQRRMIDQSPGERAYKTRLGQHLDAMLALCETVGCRRQNLLGYFGEASGACGNCDTCLEAPETWDGLVPAQKLLSTIVRLQRERGQAFGAGHLVDILRGTSTDRVRQQGHDALSTYGLGADLSDQDWRSVIRQLLARGILVPAGRVRHARPRRAGRRRCCAASRAVPLRRDVLGRAGGGSSRVPQGGGIRISGCRRPAAVRVAARVARRGREGAGVPAYIVFGDATLRALAEHRPATPRPTWTASPASAPRSARPTARPCSRSSPAPESAEVWRARRAVARAHDAAGRASWRDAPYTSLGPSKRSRVKKRTAWMVGVALVASAAAITGAVVLGAPGGATAAAADDRCRAPAGRGAGRARRRVRARA